MTLNLKQNLIKPLKEKDAIAKIGLFALVNTIYIALSLTTSFSHQSTVNTSNSIALFASCIQLFVMPVMIFVNLWYSYEYTSAGIENRETVAIWKTDFSVSLKRAGKMFLVALVYLLPIAMIALILAIFSIMAGIMFGAAAQAEAVAFASTMIVVLLACAGFIIFIPALYFYQMYVVAPAQLHMIRTHTFSNAFKIGEAREFLKKADGHWAKLVWLQVGLFLAIFILYIIGAALIIILIGIPILLTLYLVLYYYQSFAYPILLGDN